MDIKKMMKLAFKEGNGCAQMPSDYWEGIDRDFEEWYLENFKLLDDQSEEVNEDSIKKYCGKVVATIEKSKHLDEGVKVVFTDDSYIECYWNSCEGDIALSITNENECKNKDANPMCRLPDEIPECYNNCPYYSPKYLDYDSIKELGYDK